MTEYRKGSYTLLIKHSEDRRISVGSLGDVKFLKSFYAYNGSAFGPGGLKRVERHKEKSKGNSSGSHWHIDYLLNLNEFEIVKFFKSEENHECGLSSEMEDKFDSAKGFGCSDCGCSSNLFYSKKKIYAHRFFGRVLSGSGKVLTPQTQL
jgi:endonuclease-3